MNCKIFAPAFALFFAATAVAAQDAEEILESYFNTVGQENLLNINTITISGIIDQAGMQMPFKSYAKRPGKGYLEADVTGSLMKMGYDGKNGWMLAPFAGSPEPIDLTGPDVQQVRDLGDMDSPLWKWEEKGHKLDYTGTEEMDSSMVYILKLTLADGNINNYYFDTETHLLRKITSTMMVNGSENLVESYPADYREVGGIMQAFRSETRIGGETLSTIIIEEIKYDEEIDDSVFEKPEL